MGLKHPTVGECAYSFGYVRLGSCRGLRYLSLLGERPQLAASSLLGCRLLVHETDLTPMRGGEYVDGYHRAIRTARDHCGSV